MRRNAIQRATLMQRVADQAKFVILEIAQAAVDQLARRRRRATAPVTLLDQRHRQTAAGRVIRGPCTIDTATDRSEEHTSELQSLMRNSYAVFCLKKKKKTTITT